MTALSTVIGRGATGAQPAAATVPVGSLYYDTTLNKMERSTGAAWEDCEPIGTGGDVTYVQLLAMQIQNEIKGWPSLVKTGDLDALNLWWDKVGTPSTAPSVVAGNDGGITLAYNEVLKVVADAGSEGLSQRFTFADEPRVKAGRRLSTLWAIWCVGGVGATLSIINSSSEETAAAKVTAAAWTVVEVPNHLLAGTYCDIKIVTDGAGTFYAVPLGANIGARGLPLKPRGMRYVDVSTGNVANNTDSGGTWVDLDMTAATSNLCCMVNITGVFQEATVGIARLDVRRNGDTTADNVGFMLCYSMSTTTYGGASRAVVCDDGQGIEYGVIGNAAGNTEHIYISVAGWWEWE